MFVFELFYHSCVCKFSEFFLRIKFAFQLREFFCEHITQSHITMSARCCCEFFRAVMINYYHKCFVYGWRILYTVWGCIRRLISKRVHVLVFAYRVCCEQKLFTNFFEIKSWFNEIVSWNIFKKFPLSSCRVIHHCESFFIVDFNAACCQTKVPSSPPLFYTKECVLDFNDEISHRATLELA